jgi:hypothetical protein
MAMRSGDVPWRRHAAAGERCVGHDPDDIPGAWRRDHQAVADEHGYVSGRGECPVGAGCQNQVTGESCASLGAVPSFICVNVVRVRECLPAAQAATIRLEQSYAAGPFAPKT